MAKLKTDEALLKLLDSDKAKLIFTDSYIAKIKHRVKTNNGLTLNKKIEILEKLGAVPSELTWSVDSKTNVKK